MPKPHPTKPSRYLIERPTAPLLTLEERAFQMWAVHPSDLDEFGMTREQFFLAHLNAVLEQAAYIAEHGCLVEPDGGSPTEAESEMCERIAARIRARIR